VLMMRSRSWEISAWLLVMSCHVTDEENLVDGSSLEEERVGNMSRKCTYLEAKGLSVSSSSGHFDLFLLISPRPLT